MVISKQNFNKAFLIISSIVFLYVFISFCFAEANLAINPDTEKSQVINWATYNNSLTNQTGWVTETYHSSTHSLKILNPTGKNAGWNGSGIVFNAPYPKVVTLGGWSKAQNITLGTKGLYCLDFYIEFEDNTSIWYAPAAIRFTPGTHNWEKKEVTYTATKGIRKIRPYCLLYYGATGTAWFDDIYVIPKLNSNLVPNPNIEKSQVINWATYNNSLTNQTGWVTETYHSSNHSLKILNPTGKNAGWYGSDIVFKAPYPKIVTLGGWSKAQNITLGTKGLYCLDFYIEFEDNTSAWYYPTAVRFTPGTHNWEKKEVTYTATKGIRKIRPYCLLYYGATGTAWFDDIYVISKGIDTAPPTGTIKINNNAQYANISSVTLTLSATDSGSGMAAGSQMQFSNDNSTWSAPQAYATAKAWTLSSGSGTKTVYAKFKDAAGNWSQGYSDTIILDTTLPALSITPINSPTNKDVILSYAVSDNLTPKSEIIVSGNNSPYVNAGSYNITLTAKDKAGNSLSKSVIFTIDKTPPVIIIDLPKNGTIFDTPDITLSGKIDGTPFTETIALTKQGENILTKASTDLAGNTNSVSVTVYLYSGELIGPEGGEVNSPDGKVRIIIPQGALSESKRINILTIKKEFLENAAPSGKSLLSVVECRPYGLIFNKPARIIYTLDYAEVPGTSVELGLYDAIQQKIVRTGNISTVASDSYSVGFSIMHFSTYAALKNLISQGAPIGSGVKIPLPDMLTGAFSHSIPITVPPGRKGIQPGIVLVYRSSNPNSWVGLGFSLNPGYIVRSTRLGPPTYDDTKDTFYFNNDSGTTELVHLVDNLYQARIESSFTKFFKESDDSWKVVGKDGGILRFGQDNNAKEGSTKGTFSWYLTKIVDNNGNYIDYSYIKGQGKCYLSRIDYTGNEIGVSPTNSIEFILESREDISSNYMTSARIATAKRLKEIQVKLNTELVWRYKLEYNYSQDTNRSLLKSIIQYGSDGKSLPAQRFEYQGAE